MNKTDGMVSNPVLAPKINPYREMWMKLKKKSLEIGNTELLKLIAEIEIENVDKIYNPVLYGCEISIENEEKVDKIVNGIMKKIVDKTRTVKPSW